MELTISKLPVKNMVITRLVKFKQRSFEANYLGPKPCWTGCERSVVRFKFPASASFGRPFPVVEVIPTGRLSSKKAMLPGALRRRIIATGYIFFPGPSEMSGRFWHLQYSSIRALIWFAEPSRLLSKTDGSCDGGEITNVVGDTGIAPGGTEPKGKGKPGLRVMLEWR